MSRILVLRSGLDTLVLNETGAAIKDDFEYGVNTEVRSSCGITWKNKHYVFGGGVHTKQISLGERDTYYLQCQCYRID